MARPRTIRVLSFAKFQSVLMAYVGLIAGILYSFGGAIYDIASTGSVNLGTALAFLALIGMPVAFAVVGVTLGLIEAVLYNFFAGLLGGIDIDFVQ
jgi:hypothetical protein